VQELAAGTVHAVAIGVELLACLSFVVVGQMDLSDQLVLAMSEAAPVLELAFPKEFPVAAHLGPKLHLIVLDKVVAISLIVELLLGLLYCCHLSRFSLAFPSLLRLLLLLSSTVVLVAFLGGGIREIVHTLLLLRFNGVQSQEILAISHGLSTVAASGRFGSSNSLTSL